MLGGHLPERSSTQKGRSTIYRITRPDRWYVLMLLRGTTWNPVDGGVYSLQLSGFGDTSVSATVISSTRTGGEQLLRLEVVGSVVPVLEMRVCEATIGDYVNMLLVPKTSIYRQDNTDGIVLVYGAERTFIPVRVVGDTEEGKVFIESTLPGVLSAGQTILVF